MPLNDTHLVAIAACVVSIIYCVDRSQLSHRLLALESERLALQLQIDRLRWGQESDRQALQALERSAKAMDRHGEGVGELRQSEPRESMGSSNDASADDSRAAMRALQLQVDRLSLQWGEESNRQVQALEDLRRHLRATGLWSDDMGGIRTGGSKESGASARRLTSSNDVSADDSRATVRVDAPSGTSEVVFGGKSAAGKQR